MWGEITGSINNYTQVEALLNWQRGRQFLGEGMKCRLFRLLVFFYVNVTVTADVIHDDPLDSTLCSKSGPCMSKALETSCKINYCFHIFR
jgi:hypothetical protein